MRKFIRLLIDCTYKEVQAMKLTEEEEVTGGRTGNQALISSSLIGGDSMGSLRFGSI